MAFTFSSTLTARRNHSIQLHVCYRDGAPVHVATHSEVRVSQLSNGALVVSVPGEMWTIPEADIRDVMVRSEGDSLKVSGVVYLVMVDGKTLPASFTWAVGVYPPKYGAKSLAQRRR